MRATVTSTVFYASLGLIALHPKLAAAAPPPSACYDFGSNSPDGGTIGTYAQAASCFSSYEAAARSCCSAFSGFAMGGLWTESPMQTHHNSYFCFSKRPQGSAVRQLDLSKCDQPCPGRPISFKADNGICGGGCGGCPTRRAGSCISDPSVQCGQYWSYYDCPGVATSPPKATPAPIVTVPTNVAAPRPKPPSVVTVADVCKSVKSKHPEDPRFVKYCTDLCQYCKTDASHPSVAKCLAAENDICEIADSTSIDCKVLRAAKDEFYDIYCRETVCNHCNSYKIPKNECLDTGYWLKDTCKFL